MVRRVTGSEATFFVATSVACEAFAVVYRGEDGRPVDARPALAPLDLETLSSGEPMALTQIGKKLFVGLLRVDVDAQPGELLYYDLRLTPTSTGTPLGLNELGLLGGFGSESGILESEIDLLRSQVPLGYVEKRLPSFLIPPGDAQSLRFVHASCRKPHGQGDEPDALELVDDAILRSIQDVSPSPTDPLARPHQLMLTGDQIYADDVAGALLLRLTEVGDELLGWDETIPTADYKVRSWMTDPGWRTRFLATGGLRLKTMVEKPKDDYSANHLLKFSEWCAMYLCVWSDALWRVDAAGSYTLALEPKYNRAIDAGGSASKAINLANGWVEKLSELAGESEIGLKLKKAVLPKKVLAALEFNELAADLHEFAVETAAVWKDTRKAAMSFAGSLLFVRRALANVSTYMMFDDHEVTDDWNLNARVRDRLLGVKPDDNDPHLPGAREVGPRLLRNALSAYAIFQHWGNVPGDFEMGTHGEALLEQWKPTADGRPSLATAPRGVDEILGIAHPDPEIQLDPDGTVPSREEFTRFRWDYAIEFNDHRLVMLDTRTWRHYPTETPALHDVAKAASDELGDFATNGREHLVELGAKLTITNDSPEHARDVANVLDHLTMLIDAFHGSDNDLVALEAIEVTLALDELTEDRLIQQELEVPVSGEPFRDLRTRKRERVAADLDPLKADRSALRAQVSNWFDRSSTLVDATSEPALSAFRSLWISATDRSTIGTLSAVRACLEAATRVWRHNPALEKFVDESLATLGALEESIATVSSIAFRSGLNRVAPGLISQDALAMQVEDPLRRVGHDASLTVVVSPAPVVGNWFVEMLQAAAVVADLLKGLPGEEIRDYEAWSANAEGLRHLTTALRKGGLGEAIVLSGDVHYATTSVAHVDGLRLIQLTSSAVRNTEMKTIAASMSGDLLYDASTSEVWRVQSFSHAIQHGTDYAGKLLVRQLVKKYDGSVKEVQKFIDTPFSWKNVELMLGRLAAAPGNSSSAILKDAGFELAYSIEQLVRLANDPLRVGFGDYLTGNEALLDVVHNRIREAGLDPHAAHAIKTEVLTDQRPDRLGNSPAKARKDLKERDREFLNKSQRRIVGTANVGFVSLQRTEPLVVEHDIRWYPAPSKPAGHQQTPRGDYVSTLHGVKRKDRQASPLPAGCWPLTPGSDFGADLAKVAASEFDDWRNNGWTESHKSGRRRRMDYWSAGHSDFDEQAAWSAMFVSWVVLQAYLGHAPNKRIAGLDVTAYHDLVEAKRARLIATARRCAKKLALFKARGNHFGYVNETLELTGTEAVLLDPYRTQLMVGDLVLGGTAGHEYEIKTHPTGEQQLLRTKGTALRSHVDIVVQVGEEFLGSRSVYLIGGNTLAAAKTVGGKIRPASLDGYLEPHGQETWKNLIDRIGSTDYFMPVGATPYGVNPNGETDRYFGAGPFDGYEQIDLGPVHAILRLVP